MKDQPTIAAADTTGAVIPQGVAYKAAPGPVTTRDYVFLTLPRFTLLAFAAAIDPLRIANQLSQKPLYRWRVASADGAPAVSSSGVSVAADCGLGPVDRRATVLVCAGVGGADAASRPVLDWLRAHDRRGGTAGGICTGACTLARAGLLGDEDYTLHWENQAGFRELFGRDPLPQLYVLGERHMTCAGGAASTDMMLAIIARDHGDSFAAAVGEMCLHGQARAPGTGQRMPTALRARTRNPAVLRIVAAMEAHIEEPLACSALARIGGLSARQMERQFATTLGRSPGQYYRDLRLARARAYLLETDLSLADIAAACGFASRRALSQGFRALFGVAPADAHRARL